MSHSSTCPHCGEAMAPIRTPIESSWGGEIHYICFNDQCCYFVASWDSLTSQGIERTGYRCRMDPRGCCGPAPVWSEDALKDLIVTEDVEEQGASQHFSPEELARDDETPDVEFYAKPRFVNHLDTLALSTVESLYSRLIAPGSRILDLMAGPDSHLGTVRERAHVAGLGLNREELESNELLNEYVVHDLNTKPHLPFEDHQFDAVVCTVSVDYMTAPVEVFRDVARILKPGGIFIVVFSNRMFPPKAVSIWKNMTEKQRVELVRKYFTLSERFRIAGYYESTGKARPKDDKYYNLGIPSDPIYAVWGTALK